LSLGLIERSHQRGKWVLSRRLHLMTKTTGAYTRHKNLDRETSKQLLIKHLSNFPNRGAKMEEFRQVLPHLDRGGIQVLLRELRKAGEIHSHGATNAGRWYLGPENSNCNHDDSGTMS